MSAPFRSHPNKVFSESSACTWNLLRVGGREPRRCGLKAAPLLLADCCCRCACFGLKAASLPKVLQAGPSSSLSMRAAAELDGPFA